MVELPKNVRISAMIQAIRLLLITLSFVCREVVKSLLADDPVRDAMLCAILFPCLDTPLLHVLELLLPGNTNL